MQRALGASEPPGFPMIKFQPSPKKEMLAKTQNQETAMSSSKEDIPKTPGPQKDLVSVTPTENIKQGVTGQTKPGGQISSPLPDKTPPPTTSKTEEGRQGETPKGQNETLKQTPTKPQAVESVPPPGKDLEIQKLQKAETCIAKPAPTTGQEKVKEEPPKLHTSIAKPAPLAGRNDRKEEPPKSDTSFVEPALPAVQEKGKQEPPMPDISIAKPVPPAGQEKGKQESSKPDISIAKPLPPTDQDRVKQEQPKLTTSNAKPAPQSDQEVGKMPPKQPAKNQAAGQPTSQVPKAGTSPGKSAPQPAPQPKQESGGFFGFGAAKTQPAAAPTAGSVTGKMFGFGSSFLSSASTLLTSAVQDEPKTTPPTPRKMSTVSNVSPKTTPPASPKAIPVKESKQPAALRTEEKRQEKPQQTQTATTAPVKAPPETPKAATQMDGAPKADLPICPLCKDILNKGSKDPPNFNTCTECKSTVCKQCGFNPTPNVVEVIPSPFLFKFFNFNQFKRHLFC